MKAPFQLGDIVWSVLAADVSERGKIVGITNWADKTTTYEVLWHDRETESCSAYELTDSYRPDFA